MTTPEELNSKIFTKDQEAIRLKEGENILVSV